MLDLIVDVLQDDLENLGESFFVIFMNRFYSNGNLPYDWFEVKVYNLL